MPSQLGKYESSPATNGIRAEPASHAEPIPAIDTLSNRAKGRQPRRPRAAGHVADGLDDPLQHTDVAPAYGNQQSEGRRDVEEARKHAAPGHGAGQSFLRVLDFVAHHRGKLQADQRKANHPKRIEHESGIRPECESPHR